MGRRQELQEQAERYGLFFREYSPGDGVTRYRFFRHATSDSARQTYFGPDNGIHTALGLKDAEAFVDGFGWGLALDR